MSGEDEAIPQPVPGAHPQPPAQVAAVQLKLPPLYSGRRTQNFGLCK